MTNHAWLRIMLALHKANPAYHLPPAPWTRRTGT